MRLDLYLLENHYFDSRTKARNAIESEAVMVNGKIIKKASFEVDNDIKITIIKDTNPYISRGGLKLEAAIKEFHLDFKDKIVLDIGSSTGGFTDCSLKFGAKLVYAVDVGTDQLDNSLRNRNDVILFEQTNILDVGGFDVEFDYIVMDVSFVSINKILPAINRFLSEKTIFVCLIKPQFEVGKVYLKNGIVKDRTTHINILNKIIKELSEYNLGITKLINSPILGGSGNKEFLACIKKNTLSKVNILEVCK